MRSLRATYELSPSYIRLTEYFPKELWVQILASRISSLARTFPLFSILFRLLSTSFAKGTLLAILAHRIVTKARVNSHFIHQFLRIFYFGNTFYVRKKQGHYFLDFFSTSLTRISQIVISQSLWHFKLPTVLRLDARNFKVLMN